VAAGRLLPSWSTDGVHAGGAGALDVDGEVVAHVSYLARLDIECGQRSREDRRGGLGHAELAGDRHALETVLQPRSLEFLPLLDAQAVADQPGPVLPLDSRDCRRRARNQHDVVQASLVMHPGECGHVVGGQVQAPQRRRDGVDAGEERGPGSAVRGQQLVAHGVSSVAQRPRALARRRRLADESAGEVEEDGAVEGRHPADQRSSWSVAIGSSCEAVSRMLARSSSSPASSPRVLSRPAASLREASSSSSASSW
jgi:hypothetical protein